MIGEPSRTALEEAESSVQQRRAVREARLERLRAEVMVVEHEPEPCQSLNRTPMGQKMSGGLQLWTAPKRPRRTALSDSVRVASERVGIFDEEGSGAAPWAIRPVLVDLDSVDDLVGGVSRTLGADHRHAVAGSGQGSALQPDPAVEWHRQVLDDDQDAISAVPLRLCLQQGSAPRVSAAHPGPVQADLLNHRERRKGSR